MAKKNKVVELVVASALVAGADAAVAAAEETTETVATASEAKAPKKRAVVTDRRGSLVSLVEATLNAAEKPMTHTDIFKKVHESVADREPVQVWGDVGHVLTAFLTSGKVLCSKQEGKRRSTFTLPATEAQADETSAEA